MGVPWEDSLKLNQLYLSCAESRRLPRDRGPSEPCAGLIRVGRTERADGPGAEQFKRHLKHPPSKYHKCGKSRVTPHIPCRTYYIYCWVVVKRTAGDSSPSLNPDSSPSGFNSHTSFPPHR